MVVDSENSDWVSFEGEGFETVVRDKYDSVSVLPQKSERVQRKVDSPSVTSWMKTPIESDRSWAPVAPPESREPPVAPMRRPPRTPTRPRQKPVTSASDSDVSSSGHNRGKVSEMPKRRGRSSSRSRTGPKTQSPTRRPPTRTRSTSSRQSSSGNSVSRRPSGSRPPSSARRSRSTSRTPSVNRSYSSSRSHSANKLPPSTTRTRQTIRRTISGTNSVGPGVPRHRTVSSTNSVGPGVPRRTLSKSASNFDDAASFQSFDINIGRDITFGTTNPVRSVQRSNSITSVSKRPNFVEKLIGDKVSEEAKQAYLPRPESPSHASVAGSVITFNQPERSHSRILLTATVYHNTATNLWIATINTNQRGVSKNPKTASKYLKAFSFNSEKEARESAIANAPPKMMPFKENPTCFICNGKFALFRRACHCRNCGVCVCSSCSTTWSASNIPSTYNLKKESKVRVCKSCNFLSAAFKKALLDGDYEESIALYGSGNINLRTPFPQNAKKKGEVVHPIHCAVQGGNLDIVRWLTEDHFCPIKVVRTGSAHKHKRGGSDMLIKTSKDRSVLTIAISNVYVDILRYLVVDRNVSIYDAKDLKSSLRVLEAALLALPGENGALRGDLVMPRWDDTSFDENMTIASSLGADQTQLGEASATVSMVGSVVSRRQGGEKCIICYDNTINSVMTPCGHQVCCLTCSANLSACPMCNMKGEFIKIFRP